MGATGTRAAPTPAACSAAIRSYSQPAVLPHHLIYFHLLLTLTPIRKNLIIKSSVAELKLFIFGSGSDFVHNFGSGSSSSHVLPLKTVL